MEKNFNLLNDFRIRITMPFLPCVRYYAKCITHYNNNNKNKKSIKTASNRNNVL